MPGISASVGANGENKPDDVRTIQKLLNEHTMTPLHALVVDGHAGERTIASIRHFQSRKMQTRDPDGRVDPHGRTLRALVDGPGASNGRLPVRTASAEDDARPRSSAGRAEQREEARYDRKRRSEFVGASVREQEITTRIIDTIEPHFRGVRAKVISGYLNDADLFWKINYHWDLLLWMVEHSLTLNITATHRKALTSIRSALKTVKPDPEVGYRESATLGKPSDRSTIEAFDSRYKVLRQAKRDFKKVMTEADLTSLSNREEKAYDLAAAPVAHPGTSKHSTGYALDIEGDNSRISAITKQLGATLVFDEKSHVHVEFRNGARSR